MQASITKQVEVLNRLIKEKKISVKDLPALVKEGLNPEVVALWNKVYG